MTLAQFNNEMIKETQRQQTSSHNVRREQLVKEFNSIVDTKEQRIEL